ncbi:AlkA N-terminal domain-containing protein [Kribbella sindirgiensis]|uniref:DNA-3-methyladenine glycosylase 2 family protein n=1 Tax=Kribbella sindirgiensis TaxID=1124744 RepID=A0A4R0IT99_9ACTN|nr:AlkA N-terminal domain-containing protein [Kribbella sindirgiensis]TCC37103.1 DNA-3-methyladenine glycosylase 2 family protein [Kribbella sindirgiensis]
MTTYSAVRTTGIYCRPRCGAKPLAENVSTFELPAAAEAAGYRACLRCRPYRVAGTVADEAPELVCRAVQLIIAGLLDESGEEALGARLGVSARHLRRMFHEHLGVTPDQFAMREIFHASPRALRERRRRGDRLAADGGLVLWLPFTPPYDWDAMSTYLAARAVPGVESVEGGVYRRTISLDGEPGLLEVGAGGDDHLMLRAHLPFWEGVIHVVGRVGQLVGLDQEPVSARAQLAADADLGPLVAARPGIRVPGAWGPFEVAVQAVVRDRLGPEDANEALRKLVEVYGVPVPGLGHGLTHLFPGPEALTGAELVGPLAREVANGNLMLGAGGELEAVTSPRAAQEIALRLGARDAWPFDDEAEHLRPWRSLAAAHRLL